MSSLIDGFDRRIRYVRISITDRCDFRCVYCMSEEMEFLPRSQVLSIDELAFVAEAFASLGVEKIRLTGGEPLVRRGVSDLVSRIGKLSGVRDLAMTTNGSMLGQYADELKQGGLNRLNISLDSLRPDRFKALTRTGDLNKVLAGMRAAKKAGFEHIKLNAVILRNRNDDEILDLVQFACNEGVDISFIEEMPLGDVSDHRRDETFMSNDDVYARIAARYDVLPLAESTLGPSRYYQIIGESSKIGFISPHSHNFCGDCNRVRVTVEGRLLLCLGNEHSVDLKQVIRDYPGNLEYLKQTIVGAMSLKPERHHFTTDGDVQVVRMMNMTGG